MDGWLMALRSASSFVPAIASATTPTTTFPLGSHRPREPTERRSTRLRSSRVARRVWLDAIALIACGSTRLRSSRVARRVWLDAIAFDLNRGFRSNAVRAHKWTENLGHDDLSVRLLVLVENRNQCPTNGQSRSIERMHEAGLRPRLWAIAALSAAGLVIREPRATRDLAVFLLGWQPDLQVIRLGRACTDVARTQSHHTVM